MITILAFLVLLAAMPDTVFAKSHTFKKIVLIAGKKSHGPGAHEYLKSVKLLKVLLDRASNLKGIRTEIHFNGWPENPATLNDADTIVTISDGQDGDRYSPVPFMTEERMKVMDKQMRRGCGFMTFHFSTFTPDRYGPQILEWGGGYFDWQGDDGARNWYSAIRKIESDVTLGAPEHPITRGVAPLRYTEEFYYKIRFRHQDPRLKPILMVPALGGTALEHTVAWAVERPNGGRGFGATIGHFYSNWQNDNYRRLILNAIVWTAGAEVPPNGVESRYLSDEEVNRSLLTNPIPTVILTGHHHPAHLWKETTPAIIEALNSEWPRFDVAVVEDPEFLASKELHRYRLVVLNYCNWERPGLSQAAKSNFMRYLKSGGGLTIIHFANGAFHFSLPNAADSDWPEYRKICRRVWDHTKGVSGHDKYGPLRVTITLPDHPATRNVEPYDTTDELYFRQAGDEPIQVLATARSQVTGQDEPMAFVFNYRKARVFQTVLGHSGESIQTPGTTQLIRYGSLWAAKSKAHERSD